MSAGDRLLLRDVKIGDTIIADRSLTCMRPGPHLVVDGSGEPAVYCGHGFHYLSRQTGDDGALIGFSAP